MVKWHLKNLKKKNGTRYHFKNWFVYVLKCSDDTLYTGITTDISKRLKEHNESKKGAKYTRSRRPVSVVYTEEKPDRSSASKREYEIKKLKRIKKLKLIEGVKMCPHCYQSVDYFNYKKTPLYKLYRIINMENNKIYQLRELIELRDNYNGEELDSWCDWKNDSMKHVIYFKRGEKVIGSSYDRSSVLAFKSESIRDKFSEDLNDLYTILNLFL